MKKIILQFLFACICLIARVPAPAQSVSRTSAVTPWNLVGNAGIDTLLNFLGTTDKKPIIFKTNGKERMRLLNSGELGIGTSKPAATLNVIGSTYVTLTAPGNLMLGNAIKYNLAMDDDDIQARINGNASSLYLNYYGGNVFLGANGSVSISTGVQVKDPIDGLAFYSSKSGNGDGIYMEKISTTSSEGCIVGNGTGKAIGVIGYSNTSSGVFGNSNFSSGVFGFAGPGGDYFSAGVNGYGNYGVYGTTVDNSNYYAGYFVGDVLSTTGVFSTSDQTLKKNISEFSKAMDIISQLHPKAYEFRHDGDYKTMNLPSGKHYGLIAQDVEKVLPELVKNSKFNTALSTPDLNKPSTENKNIASTIIDFKALNYTELIPIIIKGMQEQEKDAQSMKDIITQQQQQIDELKQLVQTMASNQSSASKSSMPAGAYLMQNNPNPFNQSTTIRCNIPSSVKQAQLVIYSADGKAVKSFSLNNKGMNEVTLTSGSLQSGQYKYSLIVDGKQVDTKNMVLTN